ncbi:MAG: cation diffusion facilitator family transporter [archaeon]|nr:cation diffusion facilitator family transporter [archaeon]
MNDADVSPARRNFSFQRTIALVGAVLMLAKFLAYFMTNSVSILTDALESIVNVVAGFIGLYALYLSMQPADAGHPYGHGKAELISSTTEGALIVVAGVLILIESIERILSGDFSLRQLDVGLLIVAVAAAVNFAMGYTAIRMGRSSRSLALEASGRHLCSDTYSSVGIILGLAVVYVCSWLGISAEWIDPAMAMLFGAIIILTGVHVMHRSMNGIMDAADEEVIRQVTRCINHVRTDDVLDVHHLRVNRYGSSVHVDAHMVVPGQMTVDEADVIVENFRNEVGAELDGDVDITFMSEGCGGMFCRHCPRDCDHRRTDFVERKVLGTDTVVRGDTRRGGHR